MTGSLFPPIPEGRLRKPGAHALASLAAAAVAVVSPASSSGEPSFVQQAVVQSASGRTPYETRVRQARLLEPVGPVHPHTDPDLEAIFLANASLAVRSGEYKRRVQRTQDQFAAALQAPRVHDALPRAEESTRQRLLTPLARDARAQDAFGAVYAGFTRTYLFIDGDDPAQVAWARRQLQAHLSPAAAANAGEAPAAPGGLQPMRVIAVGGSLPALAHALSPEMRLHGAHPYADPSGRLHDAFGVKALPARVDLTAAAADVRTYRIDEMGNALDKTLRPLPEGTIHAGR